MENYYMVYNNLKKFLAEDWIFLFVGLCWRDFVCVCVRIFLFYFKVGRSTELIWFEIQPWCSKCAWCMDGAGFFAFPTLPGALSASRQMGGCL